jgi:hypothetical protein
MIDEITNWNIDALRRAITRGKRKKHTRGYVYLYTGNGVHPRTTRGYVLEHLVIAEVAMGKPLPVGAVVHHVNERRDCNANSNLVICQDKAYHHILHARMRVLEAGGDPDIHKTCLTCRALKLKTAFCQCRGKFDGLNQVCRECAADQQRVREAARPKCSPEERSRLARLSALSRKRL